jgi:Zn-dependent protease
MGHVLTLVAVAALVILLFLVSTILERRRILRQVAQEIQEFGAPMGPLPGPYPNFRSVVAFVFGAGGLLPLAGLPFCAAALLLAARARREAAGNALLAPSKALASAAAAFGVLGVLASGIVAVHLLSGPPPFRITEIGPGGDAAPGELGFSTLTIVVAIGILVFSAVAHEVAHGLVAYWSGDDTARKAGRLTLNPLPHLDLFGSALLPLFLYAVQAPFIIGWAKPVPVQVDKLRDPRSGRMAVSAAGAAFNLVAVLVFFSVFASFGALVQVLTPLRIEHFTNLFWEAAVGGSVLHPLAVLAQALKMGILVNLALGLFNLLPLPPLDGANLLEGLLPASFAPLFATLRAVGCLLLPVLMVVALCLLMALLFPAAILLIHVLGAFLVRM